LSPLCLFCSSSFFSFSSPEEFRSDLSNLASVVMELAYYSETSAVFRSVSAFSCRFLHVLISHLFFVHSAALLNKLQAGLTTTLLHVYKPLKSLCLSNSLRLHDFSPMSRLLSVC
jgi:hypothetical protein